MSVSLSGQTKTNFILIISEVSKSSGSVESADSRELGFLVGCCRGVAVFADSYPACGRRIQAIPVTAKRIVGRRVAASRLLPGDRLMKQIVSDLLIAVTPSPPCHLRAILK
jgi:hypothetical protein